MSEAAITGGSSGTVSTASGDQIILEARQHWLVLFWPFLFLLFTLPTVSKVPLFTLFGVAVFIYFIAKFLRTKVVLTTRRVYGQKGLIRRETFDLRLNKVESIIFQWGVFGRFFHYGYIEVRGTGSSKFPFKRIKNAKDFKSAVDRQIDVVS